MDIMIIHKPLAGLSNPCVTKVVDLLHEFVDFRGIAQSGPTMHRSARTCFVSDLGVLRFVLLYLLLLKVFFGFKDFFNRKCL